MARGSTFAVVDVASGLVPGSRLRRSEVKFPPSRLAPSATSVRPRLPTVVMSAVRTTDFNAHGVSGRHGEGLRQPSLPVVRD